MNFSWLHKILGGVTKVADVAADVIDHPAMQAGLGVASLVLPPVQALQMLKVYSKVKAAEEAYSNTPAAGPMKFVAVWNALSGQMSNKELKKWIEFSVQVLHGAIEVRNSQTGGKIQNFQPVEMMTSTGFLGIDNQ